MTSVQWPLVLTAKETVINYAYITCSYDNVRVITTADGIHQFVHPLEPVPYHVFPSVHRITGPMLHNTCIQVTNSPWPEEPEPLCRGPGEPD